MLVLVEDDVDAGEELGTGEDEAVVVAEEGDEIFGSLLDLFLMCPMLGVPIFLSEGELRNLSNDVLGLGMGEGGGVDLEAGGGGGGGGVASTAAVEATAASAVGWFGVRADMVEMLLESLSSLVRTTLCVAPNPRSGLRVNFARLYCPSKPNPFLFDAKSPALFGLFSSL